MLDLDLRVGPWRLTASLGPADGDDGHLDLTSDSEPADPWPVGFTGAPAPTPLI